jgi:hypothetical protein
VRGAGYDDAGHERRRDSAAWHATRLPGVTGPHHWSFSLADCDYLAAWAERNAQFGAEIASELERRGVIAELASSNRVTRWAYSQTEGAGGLTWVRADEMVPLEPTWRELIRPVSEKCNACGAALPLSR